VGCSQCTSSPLDFLPRHAQPPSPTSLLVYLLGSPLHVSNLLRSGIFRVLPMHMLINPPRTSGGSHGSGGSGGGRPPPGNPPPQDTPSSDPINTFTGSFGDPLPPAFGPARLSRQSPSPSPYGAGQETPRAPRLTSASAQLGASPVSPSAIYSAPSATPSRGGTMSPSPLPRTPPPADGGDSGWRDPTKFAVSLGEDANWLRHVSAGIMDDLSRNEMRHIAEGVADLLRAASDAGVWAWPSAELNQALSQLPSVAGSQGPSGTGGDVDMEGTHPPPPSHNRGHPPFGGRPLPHPPVGGRGGSGKDKGRAMGPAPPINFSTCPAPPKGTYAQTAHVAAHIMYQLMLGG
jgi:hypothetical protein